MRHKLLIATFLLLCAGSIFALTGFGESNTFAITEQTLPVELSSFTATATAQNYVRLSWVTQSEHNLLGYYVYRGASNEINASNLISNLIAPTNTSSMKHYTYLDKEIGESGLYFYWLYSVEIDGSDTYYGPISIMVDLDGGGSDLPSIPLHTGLRNIYPNPFNPNTTISYQLENPSQVELSIYNARGQTVRTFSSYHASSGYYTQPFDGKDASGNTLSSGVYHVVMTAGRQVSNHKIVLLK